MDVLTYGCCHEGMAVAMDGGCPWSYAEERALESKRGPFIKHRVTCLNPEYSTVFQYNAWHCLWTHTVASALKEAINGLGFDFQGQRAFEN